MLKQYFCGDRLKEVFVPLLHSTLLQDDQMVAVEEGLTSGSPMELESPQKGINATSCRGYHYSWPLTRVHGGCYKSRYNSRTRRI